MAKLIERNATAVMSNVSVPQHSRYLTGEEIVELDFWVPQSGGVGIGVSILSYNGKIEFGLMTGKELVPDPENIINRFGNEFEKLVLLTLMGSYGPEFDSKLEKAFGEPAAPEGARPAARHTQKRIPKRFRKG